MSNNMPIITLRNGLRVANFSSPHPFTFTTGEVLPACSEDRSLRLMLATEEIETQRDGWVDIGLTFHLSPEVRNALMMADVAVDIVIVPLPVLQAIKAVGMPVGKFRTVRMADRVRKLVYPDRFCV